MASPWSELPGDLLAELIARLPFPNDRARFRAVCRSWRSAVRRHGHQQLVVQPEGSFMTLSDGRLYPLPSFPNNTICIGSTDDWIALRHHDHADGRSFLLHNPFLNTSVPLELDAVIAKATKVRKVLVRSTATGDLIVAILTNNTRRPLILSRGGKDVWSPGPWELIYEYIIDIAFVGDKLHALTHDENLFPIDMGLDGDGELTVAIGRRVVSQPKSYYGYNAWSEFEDEKEEEEATGAFVKAFDEDEKEEIGGISNVELTWPLYDDVDEEWDATTSKNENLTYKEDGEEEEEEEYDEPCQRDENSINDAFDYVHDDATHGSKALTSIVRYLVESRGKSLMVKHYMQITTPIGLPTRFTCQVEVFEASANTWVPMTDGLGGDQALFVSMRFSKSVTAPGGNVEKDCIYFVNTGEVFNMRSNTCSPVRWRVGIPFGTWVFPPELVV